MQSNLYEIGEMEYFSLSKWSSLHWTKVKGFSGGGKEFFASVVFKRGN